MCVSTLPKGTLTIDEIQAKISSADQCNSPCPHCTTSYNNCVLAPLHWGSHRCANGHTY